VLNILSYQIRAGECLRRQGEIVGRGRTEEEVLCGKKEGCCPNRVIGVSLKEIMNRRPRQRTSKLTPTARREQTLVWAQ